MGSERVEGGAPEWLGREEQGPLSGQSEWEMSPSKRETGSRVFVPPRNKIHPGLDVTHTRIQPSESQHTCV